MVFVIFTTNNALEINPNKYITVLSNTATLKQFKNYKAGLLKLFQLMSFLCPRNYYVALGYVGR